jgi:hypothetical protein
MQGTRIFVGTKTLLRTDRKTGSSSWTFNRGDQVKNVKRISKTRVTFEPVEIIGGTYMMEWAEFEMMTRESPEKAKGQSG